MLKPVQVQKANGGIAPIYLWSVSRFTPRKRPGTHCTEGWVVPRAGLDGTENFALTGIRSPD
jgi:hypothetical protein